MLSNRRQNLIFHLYTVCVFNTSCIIPTKPQLWRMFNVALNSKFLLCPTNFLIRWYLQIKNVYGVWQFDGDLKVSNTPPSWPPPLGFCIPRNDILRLPRDHHLHITHLKPCLVGGGSKYTPPPPLLWWLQTRRRGGGASVWQLYTIYDLGYAYIHNNLYTCGIFHIGVLLLLS